MKKKNLFLAIMLLLFSAISHAQCNTCAAGCGIGCGCFGGTCVPALPVTLISFDLTSVNQIPVLKWTTTQEKDVDYFSIEYADDRGGQNLAFKLIQKIYPSEKTETEITTYEFTDWAFVQNSGNRYYRLTETDKDGKITILGIKYMKNSETVPQAYLKATPVPFQNELKISFLAEHNQETELFVFNIYNQIQIAKTISSGKNETFIDTTDLPNGVYFLAARSGSLFRIIKIIKE